MRVLWIVTVATLGIVGAAAVVLAGSKVYLGKGHSANQLVALDRIDHSGWDRLLKKYVDGDGFVNYATWKRSPADLTALDAYLDALGRGNPQIETSQEARLAFWINAYNAVTIRGILREYPTGSIRNHTAKLYGYNIWKDLLLRVGNGTYSLNAMEHEILRKLGEPRIHFAIVCASIACPRLLNEAYVAERLESQLAANTKDFFSRKKHFQPDVRRRVVYVSAILKWFSSDFGPTPQHGLIALADYLPSDAARRLVEQGDFSVRYLDYDWGLNEP